MEKTYLKIMDKMLDSVALFNETLSDFMRLYADMCEQVSNTKLHELWACVCAMVR